MLPTIRYLFIQEGWKKIKVFYRCLECGENCHKTLFLYGTGNYKDYVKQIAKRTTNIRFYGFQSQ